METSKNIICSYPTLDTKASSFSATLPVYAVTRSAHMTPFLYMR